MVPEAALLWGPFQKVSSVVRTRCAAASRAIQFRSEPMQIALRPKPCAAMLAGDVLVLRSLINPFVGLTSLRKYPIERYCKEGITDAEVETQKGYFAGSFRVQLGNNAGVASALSFADKYGFGPRYLDEFPDRVRAVTREQVDAVIRSRLHPEKLHLVVAGDLDSIPE